MSSPVPRSGLHILCVDDDAVIAQLLHEVLQAEGHDVAVAVDGQDALDQIIVQKRVFDLLITDVAMPRVTGPELIAALLLGGFTSPVIVFSASFADGDREALHGLGVTHIIHKPNVRELASTVRHFTTVA